MTDLVPVLLLGFPLLVHDRARQHSDGLHREFRLIVEQARVDEDSVPVRLLELSTVMSGRYGGFTEAQEDVIEQGIAEGQTTLDELRFDVPQHAGAAAVQLGAILDEADQWCREGMLLLHETPADIVDYRRWYLKNFIEQCAGEPPTPWAGPLR